MHIKWYWCKVTMSSLQNETMRFLMLFGLPVVVSILVLFITNVYSTATITPSEESGVTLTSTSISTSASTSTTSSISLALIQTSTKPSLNSRLSKAKNPILPGWNPDPSIIRVGSDYFIVTSTFEYFPGHPIYHSQDLVDWRIIGHVLNRPSQLGLFGTPSDAGVWAPSLRYHNGTFYLTSTKRYVYTSELRLFPRSFYVKTNDIFSNNWSDPIYFDSLGYDADLFWDTDGSVYCTWAGINNAHDKIYSIYQNKIDLKTGTSLTPSKPIFTGTLPHTSSARPEGPHIYLINSTYYLLIAEGGTGITHQVTIQRSTKGPSGPWENNPNNPILYNGRDLSLDVQNTGHADLVQDDLGNWWGVALGVRPQGDDVKRLNREQLGRETFLFPVMWEDGWPIFNHGLPLTEEVLTHNLDPSPLRNSSTIAVAGVEDTLTQDLHRRTESGVGVGHVYLNDFKSPDSLNDHTFYNLRTPYSPFHSLTTSPGFLRLYANPYVLGDRDSPAMLLRKQESYNETFETEVHFPPKSEDDKKGNLGPRNRLEEAGISIFYGDMLHNEIGVSSPPEESLDNSSDSDSGTGRRFVVIRTVTLNKQNGPWALTTENATLTNTQYIPLETNDEPVKLRIIGTSTEYIFGFAEGKREWMEPIRFDSSVLSTPPVGGFFFKGASFAFYNTGTGMPSLTPADFAYWKQGNF